VEVDVFDAEKAAVAVLNVGPTGGASAIWHVVADPVPQSTRLCGAWVVAERSVLETVATGRRVVVVGGGDPPEWVGAVSAGVIDLGGTLANIAARTGALDKLHRSGLTDKGNRRAPLSWPALPEMLVWDALPPVAAGVAEDPLIRPTIAVASWVGRLADVWAAVESMRTSRPHLCESGSELQPLPFALAG